MGEALSGFALYAWLQQNPEPVYEFLHVLGLDVHVSWARDLGDQTFAAKYGFFESTELGDFVGAGFAEGDQVEVVDDERLSRL